MAHKVRTSDNVKDGNGFTNGMALFGTKGQSDWAKNRNIEMFKAAIKAKKKEAAK